MATHPAENEAVRLLDELVCQAVPHPCVLVTQSTGAVARRGENEGVRISEETVSGSGPTGGTEGLSSGAGGGMGEEHRPVQEASKVLERVEPPPRGRLYCKVSPLGAMSVYGLQRTPVTLYVEQWQRLLDFSDELCKFMAEHGSELKCKER
jgi:hypothetical protein